MNQETNTESEMYINLPDNIQKSNLSPIIKKILDNMMYYSSQSHFGEFSFSMSYMAKLCQIDSRDVSYAIQNIINLGFVTKTYQGDANSGCNKYRLNYEVINSYKENIATIINDGIQKILESLQMNLEQINKVINILEENLINNKKKASF